MRTVKQEWKVLRRLAACKQAVRVHEGGEHPWAGAWHHLCGVE